ncbi:DUF2512 family protein [Paenibacillus xylaniclasticus]|uniref:DUF2512 family protein n=1 Tax=Paenibacillus xylaniclasticus TaxID=588083 RepID=UPI000FD82577|nr:MULTISPECIES: DUF2512 family protein [Paenibacillus]GFN31766.1 hypothetical protein PCURB6_20260 [Paenibacillus curdlanolyticus]
MIKFVLKWIVIGAIVVSLLMYYADVSFTSAAITATALTIIAYLVGDQLVLRLTNNTVATIVDAILAYAFLWFVADRMDWDLSSGEILVMTVIIGIAEWFIHRYILREQLSVKG